MLVTYQSARNIYGIAGFDKFSARGRRCSKKKIKLSVHLSLRHYVHSKNYRIKNDYIIEHVYPSAGSFPTLDIALKSMMVALLYFG